MLTHTLPQPRARLFVRALTTVTIALAGTALMTGCLEGPENRSWDPKANEQTLRDPAGAETLVDAAEPLITPISFPEAFDLVSQAAAKDSNNVRAQLYKKLLAIPMSQKGVLGRIHPDLLNQASPETRASYNQAVRDAEKLPRSLRDFLLSGAKDIVKEGDIQEQALRLTSAMADFREFVVAHKDDPITVHGFSYSRMGAADCRVVRYSPTSKPELADCGEITQTEVQLERPDMESLSLLAGAYQLYGSFLTAFDATGTLKLANTASAQHWSPVQVWNYVIGHGEYLQPLPKNRWSDVLSVGADAVQTLRYARRMQDEFCYNNGRGSARRPPLFMPGFLCLKGRLGDGRSVDGLLDAVALSLQGTSIDFEYKTAYGQMKSTTINLRDGFKTARKEALVPSQLNACGDVVAFRDPTLGGLLPRGDVNQILADGSTQCSPRY